MRAVRSKQQHWWCCTVKTLVSPGLCFITTQVRVTVVTALYATLLGYPLAVHNDSSRPTGMP